MKITLSPSTPTHETLPIPVAAHRWTERDHSSYTEVEGVVELSPVEILGLEVPTKFGVRDNETLIPFPLYEGDWIIAVANGSGGVSLSVVPDELFQRLYRPFPVETDRSHLTDRGT